MYGIGRNARLVVKSRRQEAGGRGQEEKTFAVAVLISSLYFINFLDSVGLNQDAERYLL